MKFLRRPLCLIIIFSISCTSNVFTQNLKQPFISSDINNFWKAYDKIITTKDTSLQYKYISDLYINRGTEGLKNLIEARNYSPGDFIDAIIKYPGFWQSIRKNTLTTKSLYAEINKDIARLKDIYPIQKPSTIYFLIGAFRTNGTIFGKNVLIGSELSLGDSHTNISEFPDYRQQYFNTYKPKANIALLCVHEYIHTQQNQPVDNLISYCLYEGVAEFISCLATGKKSTTPAIEFGRKNQGIVISKFVSDMFIMSNDYNWLWGQNRNELKERDLGYYIGYEICERYYNLSPNKTKAIKELIELDYTNEKEVERIIDTTKLFPKSLKELYLDYEKVRPTVVKILPFDNGKQDVKSGSTKITVFFSEPLLKNSTGVDFGPLGKECFPNISLDRVFGEDGKSWTFEADLKPNQRYQVLISNNFRNGSGVRLMPFLIDFKTKD